MKLGGPEPWKFGVRANDRRVNRLANIFSVLFDILSLSKAVGSIPSLERKQELKSGHNKTMTTYPCLSPSLLFLWGGRHARFMLPTTHHLPHGSDPFETIHHLVPLVCLHRCFPVLAVAGIVLRQ